jgi:hypothetical protein
VSLELDWRHVVERLVNSSIVEPVDVVERRPIDVLDVAPWSLAVNESDLVEVVKGFDKGAFETVTLEPTEARSRLPHLVARCGESVNIERHGQPSLTSRLGDRAVGTSTTSQECDSPNLCWRAAHVGHPGKCHVLRVDVLSARL